MLHPYVEKNTEELVDSDPFKIDIPVRVLLHDNTPIKHFRNETALSHETFNAIFDYSCSHVKMRTT